MKSGVWIQKYVDELLDVYPKAEAESITRIVMEDVAGLKGMDSGIEINEDIATRLEQILTRLLNHEPLQYVLGQQDFYGLKFKVNPAVLIPRSETEELVDWIIKENKQKQRLHILDIGTGSGCIALTLKKNLPQAEVFATDVSSAALEVAKENAELLKTDVQFALSDIIKLENPFPTDFDIIVSNPPYVTISEKAAMQKNVVNNEPAQALFVPDTDPLVFYKAILTFALSNLSKNGKVYFEINESLGADISKLLGEFGAGQSVLKKDMQGKDRMVKGVFVQS